MTDLTDQEFKNLTFFEKEMKNLFLEKRLIKPEKSFSAVFTSFGCFRGYEDPESLKMCKMVQNI